MVCLFCFALTFVFLSAFCFWVLGVCGGAAIRPKDVGCVRGSVRWVRGGPGARPGGGGLSAALIDLSILYSTPFLLGSLRAQCFFGERGGERAGETVLVLGPWGNTMRGAVRNKEM